MLFSSFRPCFSEQSGVFIDTMRYGVAGDNQRQRNDGLEQTDGGRNPHIAGFAQSSIYKGINHIGRFIRGVSAVTL